VSEKYLDDLSELELFEDVVDEVLRLTFFMFADAEDDWSSDALVLGASLFLFDAVLE
jgi:hypothetical protein